MLNAKRLSGILVIAIVLMFSAASFAAPWRLFSSQVDVVNTQTVIGTSGTPHTGTGIEIINSDVDFEAELDIFSTDSGMVIEDSTVDFNITVDNVNATALNPISISSGDIGMSIDNSTINFKIVVDNTDTLSSALEPISISGTKSGMSIIDSSVIFDVVVNNDPFFTQNTMSIFSTIVGMFIDNSTVEFKNTGPDSTNLSINVLSNELQNDYGVYITNSGATGSTTNVIFGNDLDIKIGFTAAFSSNAGPRAGLAVNLTNGTLANITVGNNAVITTTAPDTIGKSGDGVLLNANLESKINAIFGDGAVITVNHFSVAALTLYSAGESNIEAVFGDNTEIYNDIRRTIGGDTQNGHGLSLSAYGGSTAKIRFGNNTIIAADAIGITAATRNNDNIIEMTFGNDTHIDIYSNKRVSTGIRINVENTGGVVGSVANSSVSMTFGDRTTINSNGTTGQQAFGINATIDTRFREAGISLIFGDETKIVMWNPAANANANGIRANSQSDASEIYMRFGNKTSIELKGGGQEPAGIYVWSEGNSSDTIMIFEDETSIISTGASTMGIFVYTHKQTTGTISPNTNLTFGDKTTINVSGTNAVGVMFDSDRATSPIIKLTFGDETKITSGGHGARVTARAANMDTLMKFGYDTNITALGAGTAGNGLYIWTTTGTATNGAGSKIKFEFDDLVTINANGYGIYAYQEVPTAELSFDFKNDVTINAGSGGHGIVAYTTATAINTSFVLTSGNDVSIDAGLHGIYANVGSEATTNMTFGKDLSITSGSDGIYINHRSTANDANTSFLIGNDLVISAGINGIYANAVGADSIATVEIGNGAKIEAGSLGTGIYASAQGANSEISMIFGDGTNIHAADVTGLFGINANVNVAGTESIITMEFGDETKIKVDSAQAGINISSSAQEALVSLSFGDKTEIETASSHGISINTTSTAAETVVTMTFEDEANISALGAGAIGINAYAQSALAEINIVFGDDATITADGAGTYLLTNAASAAISTKFGNNASIVSNDYGMYLYTSASAGQSEISTLFGNNAKIEAAGIGMAVYTDGLNSINTVEFGNYATIESGSTGVYAWTDGDALVSIKFGNDADIKTTLANGYGVRSRIGVPVDDEANIVFGSRLSIETSGNNAHGVFYQGGTVDIGSGAVITTLGTGANAFHFTGHLTQTNPIYNNMTATSTFANLIENGTGTALVMDFTGSSVLYGDLKGVTASDTITLNLKDNTTWEGGTTFDNLANININMETNTTWFVNKDSIINLFNLGGGLLSYNADPSGTTFYTVTANDLQGSGNLKMNVDLSNAVLGGNFLQINGNAVGNYVVQVNHTNYSDGSDLQLVDITGLSTAEFKLATNSIAIGDYLYKIVGSLDQREWWLRVTGLDPGGSLTAGALGLMQFAKGIDRVLIDDFNKTHKGRWMIPFYSQQNFTKDVAKGFSQDIWGMFIGTDKVNEPAKIDEYGKMYFGVLWGFSYAKQNFNNNGTGRIFSPSIGVYIDYDSYENLSITGYARYALYRQKIEAYDSSGTAYDGKALTHGFNAGIDASKTINITDAIYIEPRAKISWTGLDDYQYDVFGINAMVSEGGGLQIRAGSRLGYTFMDRKEGKYEYYVDLGYAYSGGSGGILDIDGNLVGLAVGKHRFEVGVGSTYVDVFTNKWFLDLKYSIGDGMSDIKVVLGGSWPF